MESAARVYRRLREELVECVRTLHQRPLVIMRNALRLAASQRLVALRQAAMLSFSLMGNALVENVGVHLSATHP